MGILYTCLPLTNSPDLFTWLQQHGIVPNVPYVWGRDPSVAEMRRVLHALPGFETTFEGDPQLTSISIYPVGRTGYDSHYSWLCLDDYPNEETPCGFYFDNGDPKIHLVVLQHLSRVCGTLLLVDDMTATPVLVDPATDLALAYEQWNRACAS